MIPHVKGPTRSSTFSCIYTANTSRRMHAKCQQPLGCLKFYLNKTDVSQVIQNAKLMQILLRLVGKGAKFCWQKHMNFGGRKARNSICNLQAKLPSVPAKNTRICRQLYPCNCRKNYTQLQSRISQLQASYINCRQNTRNSRQCCYYTAGKFTRKLHGR